MDESVVGGAVLFVLSVDLLVASIRPTRMRAFGRVLPIGRALRVAGAGMRVKERLFGVINRSLTGYWAVFQLQAGYAAEGFPAAARGITHRRQGGTDVVCALGAS